MRSVNVSQRADRRDLAAYTLRDAAHYLRLPSSTLRQWVQGRELTNGKKAHPLIEVPDAEQRVCLSFFNLVECHVLASIRREHGVTLQRIRRALHVVRKQKGLDRPLLKQDFETDGVDLFVRELDRLVRVSDGGWQYAIREAVEASLKRVERDARGLPIKLFPFVGPARLDAPRVVQVDPTRAFGRPTLVGTGIPTAEIASRARAGEPLSELADDFGVSLESVAQALLCETRVEGRVAAA